jgi:glutaredoxin 1
LRFKEKDYVYGNFWSSRLPYCVRAKELAEKLSNERDDFNYRYIDIHAEGISKADLEKTVGKPVETVPQIFVDQKHIGGCTDFEAWAKENLGLFA